MDCINKLNNKEAVLGVFSGRGQALAANKSVFKSKPQLSPLRESLGHLRKIQKFKNQDLKFPKKQKIAGSINYNFKKRICSRMVSQLGNFIRFFIFAKIQNEKFKE